ncbi:uncharacterized protein LOC117170055 [Belonocnema kinseyi]|uniref:uncharacterized protein LOC117170055 n=1 Tax=Belonocnema kinseyi TaxID=2817044 RepID=UPI00143DC563|nr:uncharacterized protein LOC117170055 [Belonocnema kinseyi]
MMSMKRLEFTTNRYMATDCMTCMMLRLTSVWLTASWSECLMRRNLYFCYPLAYSLKWYEDFHSNTASCVWRIPEFLTCRWTTQWNALTHLPGEPLLRGRPHLPTALNFPGQIHLPHSSVMVRMHDHCFYIQRFLWKRLPHELGRYELSQHVNPGRYYVDIFIGRQDFGATVIQIMLGMLPHDPHVHQTHTPKEAFIHIGDGDFYIADQFEPFNVRLHENNHYNSLGRINYLPTNHIYVATPGRTEDTYSSPLRCM